MSKPERTLTGAVEVYGLRVPGGTSQLSVELMCYLTDRGEAQGGLGKLEHFRRAFRLMWPKYQWSEWVERIIEAFVMHKWIVIIGHQRASKCLGKGTPVMLYDGTVLPVEEVKEGMLLMGDDSTPRRVLSLARGREELFRITPSKGESWVCNKSHILSFRAIRKPKKSKKNGGKPCGAFSVGDKIDLPLTEYLHKGPFWKSIWNGYRVGVDYADTKVLPVDAYCYGVWLAEGSFDGPAITSYDGPMVWRWCEYWTSRGGRIVTAKGATKDCLTWFVRYNGKYDKDKRANPCTDFIRLSTVTGEKRILPDYLRASRFNRMQLLAGMLDGDGCAAKAAYVISTIYHGHADDIATLARSLGFYASVNWHRTTCKERNYIGECWSVYISGDTRTIPTLQKVPRKMRRTIDPTNFTLKAESIGEGDYYGFELDGNRRFLLGDFTVTHNTYTIAHCVLLDYLADPHNTLTSLATVTFEGLTLRMWADLMRAAETAKGCDVRALLHLQSTTNKLRVYPRDAKAEAAEKFQIHGIAVTQSKDAEGRIRGGHAPRRRIALDEAQNIANPIFEACINPMSAPDAKCILLTNPVERVSKFGEWCEPLDGWGSVHDTQLSWPLKKFKNGICLHLDGLQSPNVKGGKNVYTGLLRQEDVDEVRQVHGEDSMQWWALIRGWFPPDGMVAKVFPSAAIERARAPMKFDWRPLKCASLDPAFEHDKCKLHLGDLGTPVFGDRHYAINCTQTFDIKCTVSPGSEPKDYQIAHQVMEICRLHRVRPEHFIMDKTGGGRGVYAIMQKEWSIDIHGVEYGGAATDRPLRGDHPAKCSDMYLYFVSELWFRAAEYCRSGLIGGLCNLDPKTIDDLTARRYTVKQTTKGGLQVVDPKAEVKKQIGRSPDDGDAFVQFAELLERLGTRPGQMNKMLSQSQGWAAHAVQAKKYNEVYNEEKEFSY